MATVQLGCGIGETDRTGLDRLMLAELVHRNANDLGVVMALLVSARSGRAGRVEDPLGLALKRVAAVAATQRLLIPPMRPGPVELGALLAELCDAMREARLDEDRIELVVDAESCTVDATTGWMIATLVDELVVNAAKHAFRGGRGEIGVTSRVVGRRLVVRVSDRREATASPPAAAPLVRRDGGSGGTIVDGLLAALGADWRRDVRIDGTTVEFSLGLDR